MGTFGNGLLWSALEWAQCRSERGCVTSAPNQGAVMEKLPPGGLIWSLPKLLCFSVSEWGWLKGSENRAVTSSRGTSNAGSPSTSASLCFCFALCN